MKLLNKAFCVLKRETPLLMTIGAGIGVGVTAYLTGKAVLEAEHILAEANGKKDIKSPEVRNQMIKTYAPAVISGVVTTGMIFGCHALNKKIQAGYIAAYSAVDSLFNAYRMKNESERDADIMASIAVDQIKAEDVVKVVKEEPEQIWTDPYIAHLTRGKVKCYSAKESDILRCAMYTKDHFYVHGFVTIGVFYDTLRKYCSVDIPKTRGEDCVIWNQDDSWWDYYGSCAYDFNWHEETTPEGVKINSIYFPVSNPEIYQEELDTEREKESRKKSAL